MGIVNKLHARSAGSGQENKFLFIMSEKSSKDLLKKDKGCSKIKKHHVKISMSNKSNVSTIPDHIFGFYVAQCRPLL